MSVSYDFSGKVALITGSSSGIGAATAVLFSRSGAQVVITGRNTEKLKSMAKQCADVSPNGFKPLQVVADVTKEEDLDRLVKTTIETFEKLDVLVNSAGSNLNCHFTDDDLIMKFKQLMDTNLNSIVYLTHICVKYLEKTDGNIVNISSISSFKTGPLRTIYSLSKSALDMFTKCIAVELGPKGIRVNSINPGCTRTDLKINVGYSKEESDKWFNSMGALYPVRRCGEAVDIANSVLYLASDQASFITGTILVADGGHTVANIPDVQVKCDS